MDERQKDELWLRYSLLWKNVLIQVLEWRAEQADQYIAELRRQMELSFKDPLFDVYGFFYDPPTHDLFRPILGGGLLERIMRCNSCEANASLVFQRLVNAIAGSHLEREMDKPDFDWNQARQRYQSERRQIEAWLASLEQ